MKRLSVMMALIITIPLIFAGCSNNDQDTGGRQWDKYFTATTSTPANGSSNMNQTDPITIYFSRELLYGQVSSSCYTVQRMDNTSRAIEAVTGVVPAAQGNTITFNPPGPTGKWSINSTYYIDLASCIKSIDGDMLVPAHFEFSTGIGIGQISLPGKPRITYMAIENYTGWPTDCMAVKITFNESITNGDYLYASVTIGELFGAWTVGSFALYPMNFYYPYGDGRTFWLIFPYDDANQNSNGCASIYYQIGQELKVSISGGVDLDNQVMDSVTKEFDYFVSVDGDDTYICASSMCSY